LSAPRFACRRRSTNAPVSSIGCPSWPNQMGRSGSAGKPSYRIAADRCDAGDAARQHRGRASDSLRRARRRTRCTHLVNLEGRDGCVAAREGTIETSATACRRQRRAQQPPVRCRRATPQPTRRIVGSLEAGCEDS
jgi:hypothetical protein